MVRTPVAALALALGFALSVMGAGVADAAEIRFYKLNSKQQQREVGFLRNRDEPGCHNILGSREVFRVAQIGFTYCSVYSDKDCMEDDALTMHWKGKVASNSVRAQPSDRLMPGDQWYFEDNQTLEIRSWSCQ